MHCHQRHQDDVRVEDLDAGPGDPSKDVSEEPGSAAVPHQVAALADSQGLYDKKQWEECIISSGCLLASNILYTCIAIRLGINCQTEYRCLMWLKVFVSQVQISKIVLSL